MNELSREIHEKIFDLSTNGDLLRLSRTNKLIQYSVGRYMDTHFSFPKLLQPYFDQTEREEFVGIQNATDTLIVDSTAYHFLHRSLSLSTELALVVTEDDCALLTSFLESTDYDLTFEEDHMQDEWGTVVAKVSYFSRGGREIKVMMVDCNTTWDFVVRSATLDRWDPSGSQEWTVTGADASEVGPTLPHYFYGVGQRFIQDGKCWLMGLEPGHGLEPQHSEYSWQLVDDEDGIFAVSGTKYLDGHSSVSIR
ncbi:hypothetical protein BDN72DRAFT_944377 [Pluteus cervinus]|uniref:Uncharacterized protein n=2 Tax=Pluteus cervinus TaxID=181527 RepID=A0ACD3A053_9AGAR|nr:hypothetical protein BDN72DRAFT_946539 [Pluteus cervinus]TFK59558.1 hypothetical protein BDN72DRAFT_944377 [Pluteus cervinus]